MTKSLAAAALLTALAAGPASGRSDPPAVKLVPSCSGGLLVVRAAVDAPPPDLLQTAYRWVVVENGNPLTEGLLYFPGNAQIVVASGPAGTRFSVSLDANFVFGTKAQATVDGKVREVYLDVEVDSPPVVTLDYTVGGQPTPTPPQPPTPTPTPPAPVDPVFPKMRYGLATWVYNAFKADTSLTQAEKAELAALLAPNYQAGADSKTNLEDTLKQLAAANRSALTPLLNRVGDNANNIRQQLGNQVYNMIYGNVGGVVTADDLKDALREMATGLRGVK